MGKRIILLSDGTGNSAAKVWRTNVWRVYEALDLTTSEQIACYDDGVGTSSFKPLAILGGVFGWGLKRNVIDLYKFVCRNYSSGEDEIFGFGFSRGAFTIRVVVGLILNQGLIPRHTSSADTVTEAHLDRMARAAYRSYRAQKFHTVLRLENLSAGCAIWCCAWLTISRGTSRHLPFGSWACGTRSQLTAYRLRR
jgi:uncharacterized protein (DUF2235 family)